MGCRGNREGFMGKSVLRVSILSSVLCLSAYALELQNPLVKFEALGKPSFLKIKGEAKLLKHDLKTENNLVTDVFVLDLNSLNTGIDLRDEHLKEKYLKTKDHPKATLEVVGGEKSALDFTGEKELKANLTLAGKTKEVLVKAQRENNKVEAKLELKLSDFGVDIPSWSGITVSDLVKVNTSFEVPVEAPALAR